MRASKFRRLLQASLLLLASAVTAGCMEGRDAYAVTSTDTLITFQTDDPSNVSNEVSITGLDAGETLLQIDFRPANEVLYGLTSRNRIATIDPASGAATLVSTTPFTTEVLERPVMDFNPTQDFLRVFDYDATGGSGAAILRIDPATGAVSQTDGNGTLRFNENDENNGEIPQLVTIAHSNSRSDATATTLYGLDFTTQTLVRITNAGVLTTIDSINRNFVELAGFDIVPNRGDDAEDAGVAFVALSERNGSSRFFELNLADGSAANGNTTSGTEIGGNRQIRGMAVSLRAPERDGFGF